MSSPRPDLLAIAAAFACTASAAALALEAPAVVDTSSWECEYCPFEEGDVDSDVEAGVGYIDEADARFGDFTGLDEEGGYAILSGHAREIREGGWYWGVEGQDLGLDARSLNVEGGKAGQFDLAVSYDELPHPLFDTTSTPYLGAGSSALGLPADFVRAGITPDMATLDSSLRSIDIGTDRATAAVGAEVVIDPRWMTFASARRETRDGLKRHGGAFGFSAIELPANVDYVTDAIALGARYGSASLTARVAYEGSFFDDHDSELTFDNPYTGPPEGRLATAPDNTAHHLDASANWKIDERTMLSFAAVLGRLEQDEDFLPFTINDALTLADPPRSSLDGVVDTTHLNVALTTDMGRAWQFLDGLALRADVRYDERDNGTPRDAYLYAVTDLFTAGPETNLPYSFESLRYRISGTWDLRLLFDFLPAGQRLQASGGWRRDEIDRTFQEVAQSTEDMGWGRVSYAPAQWFEVAVKAGAANRDVDPYVVPPEEVGTPQNPLLRKYTMADREREFAEADLSVALGDSLSITANGNYSYNDYVNSSLGLRRSKDVSANAELSWTISEKATFTAFYGWSEIDARQNGSDTFGAPDWTALSEDVTHTGGASLRFPQIGERLALDVDWFFSDTDGDIAMEAISAASVMPTLRSRLEGVELAARYALRPGITLHGAVRYEHFDVDDWQLDGVDAATVPTLLSLGADAYDYDVLMYTLSFSYRFGAGTTAEDKPAEEEEATEAK